MLCIVSIIRVGIFFSSGAYAITLVVRSTTYQGLSKTLQNFLQRRSVDGCVREKERERERLEVKKKGLVRVFCLTVKVKERSECVCTCNDSQRLYVREKTRERERGWK